MAGNRNIKNIVTILLAGLFCWHMGSITLFPHIHIVEGVVICHSHPFSGTSDNPGHNHSQAQYETIANLSLALLVLIAILGGLTIYRTARRHSVWEAVVPVYRAQPTALSLRGPPCC